VRSTSKFIAARYRGTVLATLLAVTAVRDDHLQPRRKARLMKFGIVFANTGPFTDPVKAAAFAQAAEAAGFESLWTVEHVVVPSGYESAYPYDPSGKMPGPEESPIPDPLIWLSYVAAATSRIRLATGILILPQRNPVVLAKEVATLDHLSGGRVELGIGVGWLEEEFDAIGVPFADRGRRNDEYVEAMRALWRDDKATFHGQYANFDECVMRPQPVNGTVPIHIGGHTETQACLVGGREVKKPAPKEEIRGWAECGDRSLRGHARAVPAVEPDAVRIDRTIPQQSELLVDAQIAARLRVQAGHPIDLVCVFRQMTMDPR
jgi:probable F420-dependent oxidoreductase